MDKSKVFIVITVLMMFSINIGSWLADKNYEKTAKGAINIITKDYNFTGQLLIPLRTPIYVYSIEDFRQICLENINSKIYYYDFGDYLQLFVTNATITDVYEVPRGTITWLDGHYPLWGIKLKIERDKLWIFPSHTWKWSVVVV